MKTPKEYTDNLKNGIITQPMLIDCLYSSNKRAKNYRDKEREYRQMYRRNRYFYDKYDNIGQCQAKKEEYYKQKEIMLSVIDPKCIHAEHCGYERERIYDYDPRYKKYAKAGAFVWENYYFDHDIDDFVEFGDIELKDKPIYHYYLFYDVGADKTFHTPIEEKQIADYPNLEVVKIDRIETEGHEINDLISNQFVTKLIELIQSKSYTYIQTANEERKEKSA